MREDMPPYDADAPAGPQPPQDIPAEQAALGAMLISADAVADVVDVLGTMAGRAFYRPAHKTIFDAIVAEFDRAHAVDAVTIAHVLHRAGDLERVGGAPYLHTLMAAPPAAASAGYYAAQIVETAILRRLGEAGRTVTHAAESGRLDAGEASAVAEQAVAEAIGQVRDAAPSPHEIYEEILAEAEGTAERVTGWRYGWADVDDYLGLQMPGQLIVVGGRPGQGKSVSAINMATDLVMAQGGRGLIVSLEMSAKEVWRRIYAGYGSIRFGHLQPSVLDGHLERKMTAAEWDALVRCQDIIDTDRMIVEDAAEVGLADIRAMVRHHRPDVLYVDYLGLLRMGGRENRQQDVAEASRGLKLLAKKEQIPVVLLAQLNRESARPVRRPGLTDLRESGAIEQDADVVIFVHRPSYYDPEEQPGEVELIVAKQRNGPAGRWIVLAEQLHYQRFRNLAPYERREVTTA